MFAVNAAFWRNLYYKLFVPETGLAPMAREQREQLLAYRFRAQYKQVLILCSISALAYLLFYFPNSILMPSIKHELLFTHISIFSVSVVLIGFLWRFVRDPRIWDLCYCLMVAVSALSWLLLVSISPDSFSGVYVMGYITYIVMVYVVIMYKFIYAFNTSAIITLAACLVFYLRFSPQNPHTILEFIILCWGVLMLGIHVSWFGLLHAFREFNEHGKQLSRQSQLQQEKHKLEQQSQVDPMTGVYNRAHFMVEYHSRCAACTNGFLALLIVDIDHFKLVNDNYGHVRGDEVLIKIASVLQQVARAYAGELYRLGGEEFAVLAPCQNQQALNALAKQLVINIADLRLAHEYRSDALNYITVSVGGTLCARDNVNLSEQMRRADAAMYAAKKAGRNGYVTHA